MKISRHDRVTISNRTSHLDHKGEQTARQIKKQGAPAPCLFVSAKAKPLTGRGDWICKDERSEDGIGERCEPSQFQTGQVSLTEGTSERQKANKKARRNCLVCLPSPRAKSLTGRGDRICKDERSEDGIGERSEPSQFQTGQVTSTIQASKRRDK